MNNTTTPKEHLFTGKDLHLYENPSIFSACALWLENGMENQIATFDLIVRDMPKNRNFMVLTGIEEIIEGIKNWHYTEEEINYLKEVGIATPKLVEYLKNFKFSGDVWAMPEGTIFFPEEPIVRISAPLLEGNLFTTFLINTLSSNTTFSSKVIRLKIAAKDKTLGAGGGQRAHSFESAIKGSRAGYIVGALNNFPGFLRKYNLPAPKVAINAYHAVIKSFPSEIEAFRACAKLFPNNSRPMIDTYDFKEGVENIIRVSKELKEENNSISAVTIDSGDLYERSIYARKRFDEEGLNHIKIILASNLNEWKIDELVQKGAPADLFVAVTEVSTVTDDPKLEVVYKISELKDEKVTRPVAKFAKGKISYPGRKQIFRIIQNNKFQKDIIGLENERLGIPLQIKMIEAGKLIYQLPQLDEIKAYVEAKLKNLSDNFLDIHNQYDYPVEISEKLWELTEQVKRQHIRE